MNNWSCSTSCRVLGDWSYDMCLEDYNWKPAPQSSSHVHAGFDVGLMVTERVAVHEDGAW